MNFKPLHDRILVKAIKPAPVTKGGIIVPETVTNKPQQGEVIAIGPGKYEKGELVSLTVKVGDIIKVREGSKGKKVFENIAEKSKDYTIPAWLSFDYSKMEGKVLSKPKNTETFLDLNAILEFYSR